MDYNITFYFRKEISSKLLTEEKIMLYKIKQMNKCSYVNIKEMSGKGKYYEENL